MKLILNETEYHIEEILQRAPLGNLLKLKVKTKTPDFLGVTVGTIQASFKSMSAKAQTPGFEAIDFLGDEEFLRNMIGLIWLARRNAGEQLEVEDAGETAWSSLTLSPDDDDTEGDEVDPDPKAPSVSDQDAPTAAQL